MISMRKIKNKRLIRHEDLPNKHQLYQILYLKSYCKLKDTKGAKLCV
jgi:hypothetical protein